MSWFPADLELVLCSAVLGSNFVIGMLTQNNHVTPVDFVNVVPKMSCFRPGAVLA